MTDKNIIIDGSQFYQSVYLSFLIQTIDRKEESCRWATCIRVKRTSLRGLGKVCRIMVFYINMINVQKSRYTYDIIN